MAHPLPTPINGTEQYLAAIHGRLGELLDRLPPPDQAGGGRSRELREPVTPAPLAQESTAASAVAEPGRKARAPAKAVRPPRTSAAQKRRTE